MSRCRLAFAFGLVALIAVTSAAWSQNSSTVIGNGTYTNNAVWSNLACSANDVTAMQTLLDTQACNWLATTWSNQTASQMRSDVAVGLPAVPNGSWIFYYTGHGDNTAGYSGGLAGVNDNGSGSDLYYPSQFAVDVATPSHPIYSYVILDACGSGGFAKLANIFLQARGINALFLTATDDSLNCAICGATYSNLTNWINQGLMGAADGACGNPPDGVVTFNELDCYLTTNYDPLGVKHLYIPNGLGGTGICTARPTPVHAVTWGRIKTTYR